MMSGHPASLKLGNKHGVEDGDKGDGDDEAHDQRIDDVDARRRARAAVTRRDVNQAAAAAEQHSTVFTTSLHPL